MRAGHGIALERSDGVELGKGDGVLVRRGRKCRVVHVRVDLAGDLVKKNKAET